MATKTWLLRGGVLAACLCVSAPYVLAWGEARGWQRHSSSAGRYKVDLPQGELQRQTQTVETAVGKIDMHMVLSFNEAEVSAYTVMYNDFPVNGLDQAQKENALTGGRDGALRNVNGTLLHEKKISLDGHPGREFHFSATVQGNKARGAWRLYIVNNRLYQIGVLRFGQIPDAGSLDRFFGSFALVDG